MLIVILIGIVTLLITLLVVKKLKNSQKFDKFVKSLTEEQELEEPKTGEVINKISAAEQSLLNKAKKQKKDTERLKKDTEAIGNYLTDKGVTKPNKGKGAE